MTDAEIRALERAARAAPGDHETGAALARALERGGDRRSAFVEWARLERLDCREATVRLLEFDPWPGPQGPGRTRCSRGSAVRLAARGRQRLVRGIVAAELVGASASRLFFLARTSFRLPPRIVALGWPKLDFAWARQLDDRTPLSATLAHVVAGDPVLVGPRALRILDGDDGSDRADAELPEVVYDRVVLGDRLHLAGSPRHGKPPEGWTLDLVREPGRSLARFAVPEELAPEPGEVLESFTTAHGVRYYQVVLAGARGRVLGSRGDGLVPFGPDGGSKAVAGVSLGPWDEQDVGVVASFGGPLADLLPPKEVLALLPAVQVHGDRFMNELEARDRGEPRVLWGGPFPNRERAVPELAGADDVLYLQTAAVEQVLVVLRDARTGADLATRRVKGPIGGSGGYAEFSGVFPLPSALVLWHQVPQGLRVVVLED